MIWFDTTLASGVFKFSNSVNVVDIERFVADTWAKDQNFLELFIRDCDAGRKFGLGFKYKHGGTREEYERFIDQCVGRLKRVFGNKLIGWDTSFSTSVLK